MGMRIQKTVVATVLAAFIMAIALFAGAAPAKALGGDCSADKEIEVKVGLDNNRARAVCYSLDGDSKARPKLIRNGGPDYSGSYFTALWTYFYTGWYTCYAGCSGAYELAQR
jgi:hypothetical protein